MREIACNLLNYKDKVKTQQRASKLRGTSIFRNEEFHGRTMELGKKLRKEVKAYPDKSRVAYLSYKAVFVNKGWNFAK